MRYVAIATTLAISMFAIPAFAQGNGSWTSAGTHHQRAPIKKPHDLNKAKEASKVNGAKVKQGTPSGASSADSNTSSGSAASGAHSHPLHGAGSKQWH